MMYIVDPLLWLYAVSVIGYSGYCTYRVPSMYGQRSYEYDVTACNALDRIAVLGGTIANFVGKSVFKITKIYYI